MEYHSEIKELGLYLRKLTFKTIHSFSQVSKDDGVLFDVIIKNSCNGLKVASFRKKITSLTSQIKEKQIKEIERKGQEQIKEAIKIIISLSKLKEDLFDKGNYLGRVVIEPARDLNGEAFQNGAIQYDEIKDLKEDNQEFFDIVLDAINTLHDNLIELVSSIKGSESPRKKIVWNKKAAEIGHLISELIEQEYIIPPQNSKGENSPKQLAEIISDCFVVSGTKTNLENSLNPKRNKLGVHNQETIEDIISNSLFLKD